LRVALGGELITGVATDNSVGATFDRRLTWLRDQIVALREKIECLAQLHTSDSPTMPIVNTMSPNPIDQSPIQRRPLGNIAAHPA
jgi:hypothetical protein